MFVQRTEFNSDQRIALGNNYLLLVQFSPIAEGIFALTHLRTFINSAQSSSRWYVSRWCSEKPINAPHCLPGVSPANIAFGTVPELYSLIDDGPLPSSLLMKVVKRFSFLHLVRCPCALIVPPLSVSSSSTVHTFIDKLCINGLAINHLGVSLQ